MNAPVERRAESLGKDADDRPRCRRFRRPPRRPRRARGRPASGCRSAARPQSSVAMLHSNAMSGDAPHSPDPVGEQGNRKGQHADHHGNDTGQEAQLGVRQAPLRLQQRKDGAQHLPRHIVGNQQAERQREHQPGVGGNVRLAGRRLGHAASRLATAAQACGLEASRSSPASRRRSSRTCRSGRFRAPARPVAIGRHSSSEMRHHLLDLLDGRRAFAAAALEIVLLADAHVQAHGDAHRALSG